VTANRHEDDDMGRGVCLGPCCLPEIAHELRDIDTPQHFAKIINIDGILSFS